MRKQRGITLLELMLVLAIIAALLVGIMHLYQVVDNNRKVAQASNMVLQVYQAAAQYTELPSNQPNLNIDFCKKGYLAKNFCQRASNPWGGDIESSRVAANEMLVTLTNVPGDLCENLQSKFLKMNNVDINSYPCPAQDKTGDFQIKFFMDGKKS